VVRARSARFDLAGSIPADADPVIVCWRESAANAEFKSSVRECVHQGGLLANADRMVEAEIDDQHR